MKDNDKTNKKQITALEQLRQRVAELERSNSELKGAKEALRESEEKYRELINGMHDMVWVIDFKGNFIDVNNAAVDVLGYSREELLSMGPQDIDTTLGAKKIRGLIKGMPTDQIQVFETTHTTKDGKTIPVEIKSTLVTSQGKRAILSIARDITERKQQEKQQIFIGTHDALTGLPNRALFNDRLNVALAQVIRSREKLAVMLLDLDHFKEVNDTLGHSVGDELLQAVSKRLTGLLRKGDTVSRMGGDEFLLLLPHIAHVKYADTIAQNIIGAFHRPFVWDAHEILNTTSIGVAIAPNDGNDASTLVEKADFAMYHAKQQGRDNYQCYASAVTEKDR
jgi:diguanylate cyclase (GGDEF)-like protein/PAS domain S-box-containing protein